MPSPLFQISNPYIAIPWNVSAPEQPLRLCLIGRRSDAGAGLELVWVNRFSHGSSILAAMVDHAGQVFDWLEFWVQATDGIADTPAARCFVFSNTVLDLTWDNAVGALRAQNPDAWVATGWEDRPSETLAIDTTLLVITRWIHPASRQPWVLCRDDAALKAAGKPPYSTSLERWFQATTPAGETVWLDEQAFRGGAAAASGAAAPETGEPTALLPISLSGGKIALWKLPPIRLERFADALKSSSKVANPPAGQALETDGSDILSRLEETVIECSFGSPTPGIFETSPALEALCLRLALWHSTVNAVYSASKRLERPFFNLGADSFRIELAGAGSLLPAPWTFRTVLTKPGQAVPFPMQGGEPSFVPAGEVIQSAAASRFGGARTDQGTLRLSQIAEAGEGQVKLEGFLDGAALRDVAERTLVWVEVPLEGQALSFVASLEVDQGGARAGTRFKAVTKLITPSALKQLKAALTPRRPCQYSLLRCVSPSLDVYSLGLVGVRILLAGNAQAVSELEDDLFEIAALLPRDSAVSHLAYLAETADVNERLRRLFDSRNWIVGREGTEIIPKEIWHGVIHELMEFVAVEEEHQVEPDFADHQPRWLQVLAQRERALRNLALHVRGVLSAPRVAHEEISKVVLRFIGGQ